MTFAKAGSLLEVLNVKSQIETLLSQQLDRLSNAEISVLIWLVILSQRGSANESEPINLTRIQLLTSVSISNAETVKILDKLVRKYLVEVRGDLFILPGLIMESVTARYQELVCEAIAAKKLQILHLYPIVSADGIVDIDEDRAEAKISQSIKYILQPIINRLLSQQHSTPPKNRNYIIDLVSVFGTESSY
jgi:hypothetical protein